MGSAWVEGAPAGVALDWLLSAKLKAGTTVPGSDSTGELPGNLDAGISCWAASGPSAAFGNASPAPGDKLAYGASSAVLLGE